MLDLKKIYAPILNKFKNKDTKISVEFKSFYEYEKIKASYYFCQIAIGTFKVVEGAKTMQEAYIHTKKSFNELIDKEIGAWDTMILQREEEKQC